MATMDRIASSIARGTVHQVYAHKQMALAPKTVKLATMVISAIRNVPATVTSKNVTDKVGDVLIVFTDFMAMIVSQSVDNVLDLVTEVMGHEVPVKLVSMEMIVSTHVKAVSVRVIRRMVLAQMVAL